MRACVVEMLEEVHPGEILREDFMKPLGIEASGTNTEDQSAV